MQVLGIDRVLIATPDIDDSVATYEDRLGLSFGDRIDPPDEPVANRTSRIGIEFVSGDSSSAVAAYVEAHGSGLYAVALEVADLDAAREHLADHGIDPVDETAAGSLRELFYHPAAFEGTLIALVEYDHRHPAEIASREG